MAIFKNDVIKSLELEEVRCINLTFAGLNALNEYLHKLSDIDLEVIGVAYNFREGSISEICAGRDIAYRDVAYNADSPEDSIRELEKLTTVIRIPEFNDRIIVEEFRWWSCC